jgi:hypothetical protein
MAKTFPTAFPAEGESHAERRVFERLREALSAEYTVIAQVAWLVRRPGMGLHDGEADIVIAHPRLGLLAIEVKGGLVNFDPSMGWASNGTPVKDPFRQARDGANELSRRLRASPRTRGYAYPFGYAVWFPDIDAVRLAPRLDAPDEIILDAADLDFARTAIEGLFQYWFTDPGRPGPGQSGVDELVRLLAPSWELRPLLGPTIARETSEQQRLTEQQFNIVQALSRHRRALIAGCAG